MKIILCGNKSWNNIDLVHEALAPFIGQDITILYELYFPVGKVVADQLGFKSELFDYTYDDVKLVLAFHPYIRNSKNCKAIISEGRRFDIPYQVIGSSF